LRVRRLAMREAPVRFLLVCAACGVGPDGNAHHWRALLALEEDATETVETFCPECAKEEFGDAG
jgi:hypothetical protein